MIGEKIREIRMSQKRSLAEVATKAKISVATLSRIETDKQTLDLGVFLTLARVLESTPYELLGAEGQPHDGTGEGTVDPVVKKIVSFEPRERTQLWRELASVERRQKNKARGGEVRQQVEELIAQMDFMREELENVRRRLRRT